VKRATLDPTVCSLVALTAPPRAVAQTDRKTQSIYKYTLPV
jgi:hypothetical protein